VRPAFANQLVRMVNNFCDFARAETEPLNHIRGVADESTALE
jgi:hypothetical protein